MNKIFCERLRTLRENESRTQADMADILKVQRSTYGAYERGTILPPMDKIEALASHFGVSVDYFLGSTNEKRRNGQQVDAAKRVQDVLDYLNEISQELTLDGEILNRDSRDALISGIENSIKMARIMNRKKE